MISKVTLITVPRRYGIPTLLVALFWAVGYSAASAQNIQDGNIIIATGGTYTITGSSTAHTIKVNTGVTANITLDNVSIDV
ncbi:MAG: carbohydrate-binding domain-containing protein, partial [Tannerella sp.]|nr:carbohydrate-binding domain-containing protein [Tannerella sp.]